MLEGKHVMKKSTSWMTWAGTVAFSAMAAMGCDGGATTPVEEPGTGDDETPVATGSAPLIDDMEDGDSMIVEKEGRVGSWYAYDDETAGGKRTPAGDEFPMEGLKVSRAGSTKAAHFTASGWKEWGAEFGLEFNNPEKDAVQYDAAVYKGVTFWALAAEGSALDVTVNLRDKNSAPGGGLCLDDGGEKECKSFSHEIELEEGAWKQFTVLFSELAQEPGGYHGESGKLLANALYALEFGTYPNETYDIWIDDLSFVK